MRTTSEDDKTCPKGRSRDTEPRCFLARRGRIGLSWETMGDSMRCAAWLLVLAACKLDTSGVGGGESSDTSGGTSGDGASTTATTMPTTSAPTTGATDDATSLPTSDATMGSDPTMDATHSGTDDSTGDGELGPFDEPVAVEELNTGAIEDDVTLRSDLLEIYFSRSNMGDPTSEDIYRATRETVGDPFDDIQRVDELSLDGSADASPELSRDGLVISFSGSWPGGPGGNDVMIATREDLDAAWSDPVRIDELTSDVDDASLVMSEDQRVGYTCRDFGGLPYWELMRTTRGAKGGAWDDPTALDGLNADGRDCAPWVNDDDTELWFTTVRPGGVGAEDIWRVEIVDGDFGEPVPVAELDTPQADEDPWLSPDRHTIFFASNRGGDYDIWMATR